MKRLKNISKRVTVRDFIKAIERASEGHAHKEEVIDILKSKKEKAQEFYEAYQSGAYRDMLAYRTLEKTNNNGKVRRINSPTTVTRVFQIFAMMKIESAYYPKDNLNGLNCKKGCGLNAKDKRKSVIHRMKHIFYDRLDLNYGLVIDQRKCYEHITPTVFRRMLRNIIDDKEFVDFCVDVSFVGGKLPIGTPTSPLVHHVIMLPFDIWAKELSPACVRYADDNFFAFNTVEEAQRAKWRVKNYWWYVLGIRAKRQTMRVFPLSAPLDFCGYLFHRRGGGHSKGWTCVRRSIMNRAHGATDKNWGSYFGILSSADCFSEMKRIEKDMKLSQLTERLRINRKLDAPHKEIKEIEGVSLTVVDYEIRRDKDGHPNWVKLLVCLPDEEGRKMAYEVHGGFAYIAEYLDAVEAVFSHEQIIPIEEVVIENQCGYIFKDSTNQIKEFKS